MQSKPRILANLLAKPTRTPIGIYRGGHGGANPPTSLSQAVFPPKRGCLVPGLLTWEPDPRGKPKGQPSGCFWGVSPRVILPKMAPLILGLLGFAGSIPSRIVTDFHRFIWTFFRTSSEGADLGALGAMGTIPKGQPKGQPLISGVSLVVRY